MRLFPWFSYAADAVTIKSEVTTGIGTYLVCPSWLLDYITDVCAHQAGSQLLVDGVYEHIATNYRLSCASKKYLICPRANYFAGC